MTKVVSNQPDRAGAFFAVMLVAGCLLPVLLRAQQSGPTTVPSPRESQPSSKAGQLNPRSILRAQSNVVRIDIEVTGRDGKPIKGLRPDQFIITDDGKDQKISSFSYADIEAVEQAGAEDAQPLVVPVDNPTPTVASNATNTVADQIRNRRMIVLFFDLTSMETDDLIRAHDAAVKFLKAQMKPPDLVAVVTFGSNLSVLANFTNNRAILDKAVAQLIPGGLIRNCESALRGCAKRRIRRTAIYRRCVYGR